MHLHLTTPSLTTAARSRPRSPGTSDPARAALFLLDGTLTDSNEAHAWSWVEALRKYRFPVPFHRVRPLVGSGSRAMIRELVGIDERNPVGRLIDETRAALFANGYLLSVRAMPAARVLLERLRTDGLAVATASLASPCDLHRLLEVAGLGDAIDACLAPDPGEDETEFDAGALAVELLGLDPREVVAIGDSPHGLAAASRAGIPFIGVRSGGWTDRWMAGAVALYDDTAALLAAIDESPLVAGAARR